ncbi:Methyltransferase type 11 [Metarhizium album ARSEF 1941]|uniref:Methyltransferase type 11 n=1 Tax=Metarhizium album (strain ARSEF 1941) TaxID=1081103 RepID=A0A0B2WJR0_METAS|nr:Methyltransferase type 11 [Metarhizium album ARSEF 1941]KHN93944.1 Methyltransferase type 11 [Metarhizium album ARSEF 1941]
MHLARREEEGMQEQTEQATYTHGHHSSVLRSHTWRTARNSAAFLLPHVRPDMAILDVGCGPGTITVDLASHVPHGRVVGLERAAAVLEQARALAADRGVGNVEFEEGDANALRYPDDTFDIVFCHQVLQHVKDPVGVLREMRRVTKPGGLVAARESDYGAFSWYPEVAGMEEWQALYRKLAARNGGQPDAGRMVHAWAKRAGFAADCVTSSVSSWCYSTSEQVSWWSGLWAERTVASSFADSAVESGLATREQLAQVADTWRRWGREDDAWFSVPSGEILCSVHKAG